MAFRIVASITLILTFCLILLGGVVHSSGSSLACPDWPLCYGQFFPVMQGGVAIEHSHRLLAASIGLLTIVLAILATRQADRRLERLSMVAVALVIIQGVLGGITVLYRLPTAVSTAHLAISMVFFSLLLWIVLSGIPSWQTATGLGSGRGWILLATILIYLQIILGALVRHTGASAACPDLPFCHGLLWPQGLHPSTQLHMAHRWLGTLVLLVALSTAYFVLREAGEDRRLRFLAHNMVLLVCLQVALGAASVWSQMSLAVVTAHLAGGALLLATSVSMWFLSRKRAIA